jgi:ribosomal protein S19E (S16A)
MQKRVDVILEGVRPAEIEHLRALAAGNPPPRQSFLTPLEDKGWVETVAGIPLITLTGRTLLDGAANATRA